MDRLAWDEAAAHGERAQLAADLCRGLPPGRRAELWCLLGTACNRAGQVPRARESFGKAADLAAQTGLSTRTIQEMSHAAKMTGASLDNFTNAAFKLGTNLAGGSDSVHAAVQRLNLSYDELRRMSPDQQFETIAIALGGVEDAQDRNRLAVELYGTAAKAILPAIAQGYDELRDSASVAGDERIPVRGLRRKIAENLVRSKHMAPHYHFVEEVDATELSAFRDRMNAKLAKSGEKLSFLPFIVKAVIAALKKNKRVNAVMDEQANELVLRGEYNVGIAVATDAGLVVPVLRHADRMSMREIAREIVRLSDAARAGKLAQADVGGGTFTITSLGQTGGLFATPIINHPEVAIMGVHRMRKRPVVNDAGEIVVRDMMNLSWAFDHRNVDGAEGAKFAYDVIALLNDPEMLIAEMA